MYATKQDKSETLFGFLHGGTLMSVTPLSSAKKLVCAYQLTRLFCKVVDVKWHFFVYCFHQFGDYSWTRSCEGTEWVHRGKQCRFSHSMVT